MFRDKNSCYSSSDKYHTFSLGDRVQKSSEEEKSIDNSEVINTTGYTEKDFDNENCISPQNSRGKLSEGLLLGAVQTERGHFTFRNPGIKNMRPLPATPSEENNASNLSHCEVNIGSMPSSTDTVKQNKNTLKVNNLNKSTRQKYHSGNNKSVSMSSIDKTIDSQDNRTFEEQSSIRSIADAKGFNSQHVKGLIEKESFFAELLSKSELYKHESEKIAHKTLEDDVTPTFQSEVKFKSAKLRRLYEEKYYKSKDTENPFNDQLESLKVEKDKELLFDSTKNNRFPKSLTEVKGSALPNNEKYKNNRDRSGERQNISRIKRS